MTSKPKVLISGANGFIGNAVRKRLAELDLPVSLLRRKGVSSGLRFENEDEVVINWPEDIPTIHLNHYDFFLYLSHSPVSESMSLESVLEENLEPLRSFTKSISSSKRKTHLVFISSQSALSSVSSNYGELKRLSESFIKENFLNATIVRPGLIIGKGTSGLFNSIVNFIKISPIIPLFGKPDDLIQPVFMDDFVEVLLRSSGLKECKARSGLKVLEIAIAPIPFHTFLKTIAKELKLKRWFVRVPVSPVLLGLAVLEKVFNFKKFTSSSVFGFLQLSLLDSRKAWEEVGIVPKPIDEAISESIS